MWIRISSKYTRSTIYVERSLKVAFVVRWNMLTTTERPKGICVNWNRPWWARNAILWASFGSNEIFQYPNAKSRDVNNLIFLIRQVGHRRMAGIPIMYSDLIERSELNTKSVCPFILAHQIRFWHPLTMWWNNHSLGQHVPQCFVYAGYFKWWSMSRCHAHRFCIFCVDGELYWIAYW